MRILDHKDWSIEEIISIWKSDDHIALSEKLKEIVDSSRNKLDKILRNSNKPIYGINTGFGALCNTVIETNDLDQLQINLVRSHACGTGNPVTYSICKLVLLLKIIGLSKGYSCIRLELLEFLIQLYNHRIFPKIPEMGSLGASGDLAPLAHLSLLCIGEGELLDSTKDSVKEVLLKNGIGIPMLKFKEGLALLNGTQFSLALLLNAVYQSEELYHISNLTATMSMEAYNCSVDFLDDEIHQIRKQNGQIRTAEKIRNLLVHSNLASRYKNSVQDPYSFRCIPQVHGASLDAIQYVKNIVTNEINAVSDNPLMLSDGRILSGGNFHAQPLALSADFLGIAICELGNISERRMYQLIHGNRGLPEFLTANPGINSGFMIVQYSAASLVSYNKQMATPSSVDSIVTSKGQEDHVSMAANAALKCAEIVQRTRLILSMEWMTACRAWQFRPDNWNTSELLKAVFLKYRELLPYQENDYIPSIEFEKTTDFLTEIHQELF